MAPQDFNFQKLTPIDNVDISIYEDALDFVFNNPELKNIGITGAYCSGKSSVIESYKKEHGKIKFTHISLANFKHTDDFEKDIKIRENVLEGKILNQLIHQIASHRIPQTSFRVKKKITKFSSFCRASLFLMLFISFFFSLGFTQWVSFVEGLTNSWLKDFLLLSTDSTCLIVNTVIAFTLLGIFIYAMIDIQRNKNLFKKVSIQGNEIEIFEQEEDSYFDKYLNEVLYLFDRVDADVIVFEDMDRFESSQIFQRLREINTLVNRKRKDTLRFFYLLRDDIFVNKDRTKFFDFIIPIVPIIDSSNAYNQFISHIKDNEIFKDLDESFLQDISLYIDDMRILKNIYNEFVIYFKKIGTTEQKPEKLLAVITYKNLFPRDFNNLQLGRGFVHCLFEQTNVLNKKDKITFQGKIKELNESIQKFKNELLNSVTELENLYTNPRGIHYSLYQTREGRNEYERRKNIISTREITDLPAMEFELSKLIQKVQDIDFRKLAEIINPDNIESIFQSKFINPNEANDKDDFSEIKRSDYFDLLKYLIRNGYIDEEYHDYMTYFYANSLSRKDKVFLRSVTDQKAKGYSYPLDKPELFASDIRLVDFDRQEILNFNLLDYLIAHKDNFERKIPRFLNQLKDTKNFEFIVQYLDKGKEISGFIQYANHVWPQLFQSLLMESDFPDLKKKEYALLSIYHSPIEDLRGIDEENAFTTFISNCSDFLQIENPNTEKIVAVLNELQIKFTFIDYDVSNHELWNQVYSNNLYELNWAMIECVLVNEYQILKNEDFVLKNLSLILSKPKESLVAYVKECISDYMVLMLDHCGSQIVDNEETILFILDSEDIIDEQKESYLNLLKTQITSLKSLKKKTFWTSLIDRDLVSYSDENMLLYYFSYPEKFNDSLIHYINKFGNNFALKDYGIDKVYDEKKAGNFVVDLVMCNSLDNNKYKEIIQSLDLIYSKFEHKEIDGEKIDILIDLEVISMTEDNLLFMRDNYLDHIERFIMHNIEEYAEKIINEKTFDLKEALSVLEKSINSQYKISILENTKDPISSINSKYSDDVIAHILNNNFDSDDLQHLLRNYSSYSPDIQNIIESLSQEHIDEIIDDELKLEFYLLKILLGNDSLEHSDRKKVFAHNLTKLNHTQCVECLKTLRLDNYLSLFEGKRPRIIKNDVNLQMLKIFRSKRWITSFKIEGPNHYRVYGKKQTERKGLLGKILS